MNLVPHRVLGINLMLPRDWEEVAPVLSTNGSVKSGYEGWAALVLTPDVLAVVTPEGTEEIVPLWSIDDVAVIKFEGVLVELETSVGRVLSPLPYPHGLEITYSMEIRMRLRLRLVTMISNHAHELANDIRRAAEKAQRGNLPGLTILKR